MLLQEKPEHHICKSTESHQMRALVSNNFAIMLDYFLRYSQYSYFSLSLAITEQYPHSLPNLSPIAIAISP